MLRLTLLSGRSFLKKRTNLFASRQFATSVKDLPKRHHAFMTQQETSAETLNLEESTSLIYRLMGIPELTQFLNTDEFGNAQKPLSVSALAKRPHLMMPEHVQENNSTLLLSFSFNPMSAAKYAGINLIPNNYALVKTNLPPVFTRPGLHADLDMGPFDAYHHVYTAAQQNEMLNADSAGKFVTPINPSILAKQQEEIDMVINTLNNECDFRPKTSEMLIAAYFMWGAMRNFTFVKKPAPMTNDQMAHRDWAIEVLCPEHQANYANMLRSARDNRLIPANSRPLTVDDAVVAFPEMQTAFAPSANVGHNHVHILKYVPEDCPIGSPKVASFVREEHSKFRKQHSLFQSNKCTQQGAHDYFEPESPNTRQLRE